MASKAFRTQPYVKGQIVAPPVNGRGGKNGQSRKRLTKLSLITQLGEPRKTVTGRPTRLNKAFIRRFCKHLRNGHYLQHACDLMKISRIVIWDWMQRGERAMAAGLTDDPYAVFTNEARAAVAEAVNHHLGQLRKARPYWQAHAWFLERRHPKQYGAQQRVEMTGIDGQPIQTETTVRPDLAKLSVPELLQLRDLISKAEAAVVEVAKL